MGNSRTQHRYASAQYSVTGRRAEQLQLRVDFRHQHTLSSNTTRRLILPDQTAASAMRAVIRQSLRQLSMATWNGSERLQRFSTLELALHCRFRRDDTDDQHLTSTWHALRCRRLGTSLNRTRTESYRSVRQRNCRCAGIRTNATATAWPIPGTRTSHLGGFAMFTARTTRQLSARRHHYGPPTTLRRAMAFGYNQSATSSMATPHSGALLQRPLDSSSVPIRPTLPLVPNVSYAPN